MLLIEKVEVMGDKIIAVPVNIEIININNNQHKINKQLKQSYQVKDIKEEKVKLRE